MLEQTEIKFVLYSPRQNSFHVETMEDMPHNVLKMVEDYLKSDQKDNYKGADYMVIGMCLEDEKVEKIIDTFKAAVGLE